MLSPSAIPAGHVILSAGKDGVVAVSSLADGAIARVIEDHRGAAITAIHCVNEQVSSATGERGVLKTQVAAQRKRALKDASIVTILQGSEPKQDPNCIFINAR